MDWTDFIDFPWTPLSSAQITFDHSTPITSAAFSPTHEVVWFGDETGRISCHDIPELNSYSAAFVSPGGNIPWESVFVFKPVIHLEINANRTD